MKQARDSHR